MLFYLLMLDSDPVSTSCDIRSIAGTFPDDYKLERFKKGQVIPDQAGDGR
jgi:hypothetical protein